MTSSNATVVAIVGKACALGGGIGMRANSSQSASMAKAAYLGGHPGDRLSLWLISVCQYGSGSATFTFGEYTEAGHRLRGEDAIAGKLSAGLESIVGEV